MTPADPAGDDTPTQRIEVDDRTAVHLAPGARLFGRYTLEALVGKGGMGVVWLARRRRFARCRAAMGCPARAERLPA
jgi:hypothetical protein